MKSSMYLANRFWANKFVSYLITGIIRQPFLSKNFSIVGVVNPKNTWRLINTINSISNVLLNKKKQPRRKMKYTFQWCGKDKSYLKRKSISAQTEKILMDWWRLIWKCIFFRYKLSIFPIGFLFYSFRKQIFVFNILNSFR